MKMTIAQAVASVQNAPGSMYTREDVISLLGRIQEGGSITKDQIEELIEKVLDMIKGNADNLDTEDVCETSSAEFDLNGNEISLSSVDVNTDGIADAVVDGVGDAIEEFFEELEKEDEEEVEG